jgi:hypothetical protein
MGLLIDKKPKHKRRVLTEEKLDDVGTRLEHTSRKSLKLLAQRNGVSKSSASRTTQMLKLDRIKQQKFKHTLQPRGPASRVHFCSWFLQSVVEGEIDPQLNCFLMKHGFSCRDK